MNCQALPYVHAKTDMIHLGSSPRALESLQGLNGNHWFLSYVYREMNIFLIQSMLLIDITRYQNLPKIDWFPATAWEGFGSYAGVIWVRLNEKMQNK